MEGRQGRYLGEAREVFLLKSTWVFGRPDQYLGGLTVVDMVTRVVLSSPSLSLHRL